MTDSHVLQALSRFHCLVRTVYKDVNLSLMGLGGRMCVAMSVCTCVRSIDRAWRHYKDEADRSMTASCDWPAGEGGAYRTHHSGFNHPRDYWSGTFPSSLSLYPSLVLFSEQASIIQHSASFSVNQKQTKLWKTKAGLISRKSRLPVLEIIYLRGWRMCLPSSNWPVVRNARASIRRLENVVCYAQISGLGDAASPMPVNSRLHGDNTAAFSWAVLAKVESSRARAHTRTYACTHIHTFSSTYIQTHTDTPSSMYPGSPLTKPFSHMCAFTWMDACMHARTRT